MEEIVFEPPVIIEPPQIHPDFPAVPSAKYFYINKLGEKIHKLNNVGTPEEQQQALTIWYSMKLDIPFPLKTVYAIASKDQLTNRQTFAQEPDSPPSLNIPNSFLALSMKSKIKQYPSSFQMFRIDLFYFLIGQTTNFTIDDLVYDMYRFPLHPSSDAFTVARLLERYVHDGDESPLRKYLRNRDVQHLIDHPFGYYPLYELFFLLTRYSSYPMNDKQLRLAQRRLSTEFGSPDQIFIDSIFHYELYEIDTILQMIDDIANIGVLEVGKTLGTSFPDWVNWADEYLTKPDYIPIDYFGIGIDELTEKLNTWTDDQIVELTDKMKFELPFRSEYPNRYMFVAQVATVISRFRV